MLLNYIVLFSKDKFESPEFIYMMTVNLIAIIIYFKSKTIHVNKIVLSAKGVEIFRKESTFHSWKEILHINILSKQTPNHRGIDLTSIYFVIHFISNEKEEYLCSELLKKEYNKNLILFWARFYHDKYWKEKCK